MMMMTTMKQNLKYYQYDKTEQQKVLMDYSFPQKISGEHISTGTAVMQFIRFPILR